MVKLKYSVSKRAQLSYLRLRDLLMPIMGSLFAWQVGQFYHYYIVCVYAVRHINTTFGVKRIAAKRNLHAYQEAGQLPGVLSYKGEVV